MSEVTNTVYVIKTKTDAYYAYYCGYDFADTQLCGAKIYYSLQDAQEALKSLKESVQFRNFEFIVVKVEMREVEEMSEVKIIEVNSLKDKINNIKFRVKSPEMMAGLVEMKAAVLREIENMQTVEAEPVRHGRWIVNERNPDYADCTNCGLSEWFDANGSRDYAKMLLLGFKKFCPNCGARMNGGVDNDT